MHISKKNIIVGFVVLVVIGFGFWVNKTSKDTGYSVVYLATGEVYVGKLTTFPTLQLKNGYILQIVKDPNDESKSNFQLQPIKEVLWASEALTLVKDNVVFYGPLLSTSKIAETIVAQVK